jgi:hypothetical protein
MWIIPKALSAFVPDTEDSSWDYEELAIVLERSVMWRSKLLLKRTWLQRLNKVKWMQLLSGRILKHSQQKDFEERYTASLPDIHASRLAPQETEKEKRTLDTFGRILKHTSVQLSLFGASLKTSQDTSHLDLKRSHKAFEIWVTKLRRDCLQRQKSAHLTREKDCSSWRSPAVNEPGISVDRLKGEIGARFYDKETDRLAQVGLQQQVNWYTPKANDAEKRGQISDHPSNGLAAQALWATPKISDTEGGCEMAKITLSGFRNPRGRGSKLKEAVTKIATDHWPTPGALDEQKYAINGDTQRTKNLSAMARRGELDGLQDPNNHNMSGKSRGRLNPAWVEQLMGLIPGWTNFDSWATGSYRIAQS